jgi:hypothetical protein
MRSVRYSLPILATLRFAVPAGGQDCEGTAIDHVPIVVRSLAGAQLTYEQLGFRLKPGRLHANGLRNAFAKLPGGDYLELISPEHGAVDPQTARYVAQLDAGEGGSLLALRADSLDALGRRLEAAAIPVDVQRYGSAFEILGFTDADLSWVFLIDYIDPVIDGPELLSHPNTATHIETIWLREEAMATLSSVADTLCLPDLRQTTERPGSAPVAGVTIGVRSVDSAQQALRAAGLDLPISTGSRGRGVIVPSSRAHGIFIEFLEYDASVGS